MDFDFSLPTNPAPMLLWIVLLPLLGSVINGFFGRGAAKGLVSGVAVGTVATSFLLALYCFTMLVFAGEGEHAGNTAITLDLYRWFSVTVGEDSVPVNVRFTMDHLSGIMTVMVTGIASLIHLYSTEYMGDDPSYPRFMTYLNLFTASMLILVLGSNLPLMFVGWEGVGLCSYLLIGFWWENPAYAAAGRKAFVVNRIGDFGVLIGTFLLLSSSHTFEFSEINAGVIEYGQRQVELGGFPIGITIAGAAAFFLFIGCTGKSAQLPLYVWLPDAMAGPTPVSALIHAATMVTAGVYLCCRLSPVFMMSENVMALIAVTGALTALLGASIGVVQTQMKRILAYSTVSQLGFMFAAVGMGAFAAGIFHVFTHAFFKACLFLGAGSVMHAIHAHGDADIRWLGGMRKYMPKTRWTFALSCLAIAGFPLIGGFFSKDEILFGALEGAQHFGWVGYAVFVMLAVAAFLTAFYMFRLYFLTFEGEFRGGHAPDAHGHGDDHHAEPHESGDAVTITLMVLAVGAVLAGFLGLPHWLGDVIGVHWNLWTPWLTGHEGEHGAVAAFAAEAHEGALSPTMLGVIAMTVGSLVGVGGIGLAYTWFGKADAIAPERETLVVRIAVVAGGVLGIALCVLLGLEIAEATHTAAIVAMALGLVVLGAMSLFALYVGANPRVDTYRWAMDKWRVDELYGKTIVAPLRGISVVSANIDRIFVDGLLTWVPAQAARGAGWVLTRAQNGVIYAYTIGLTIGAAGLIWWFTYPHTDLVGEAQDANVTWTADRGPGYEYRWDFDSDGDWDTDWSTESTATHSYGGDDAFYGLVAVLEAGALDVESIEIELSDDPASVPVDRLPVEWVRAPGEGEEAPRDPAPPTVRLEGGQVVLTANDAVVRGGTQTDEDREAGTFRLSPGDTARIGLAGLRIAVRARATVQVRNVFGNFTRAREELTLRVPHTELEPIARTER
ncbi:NADH-quinone oxidoreductase subunit L [Sandaracinus amylolyticus]|uniref:NADH-quinone oxidoreductase subunit L n=1 Tax=Sandaracinus amylolyticus TaxID=927083 RepID=UPI001EFFC47F|nr:NADH-quinone oxidoreductase subunit L [Sandaracinus amylolyticus]UJR81245.1 NADH-ubiquinone oxidoreductase chain L [Sandaracinus amylolyticus]